MPRPEPCDHPTPELVDGAGAIAALLAGSRVTPLAHGANVSWLDGDRLFLQHGPSNLIVRVRGPESPHLAPPAGPIAHAYVNNGKRCGLPTFLSLT